MFEILGRSTICTAKSRGDKVALMPIPAALHRDLRTRPTDQPPFSGTFLNLPPAMISWYQDRAFLLPAEGLFQDRDRPVLRLPSAFYCR
jgi:hypothetical protein